MKIKYIEVMLVVIIVGLCINVSPTLSAQAPEYWYAYAVSVDINRSRIVKINPVNVNNQIDIVAIQNDVPSFEIANVSPDGQWVVGAFRVADEKETEIRLFNTRTNEVRIVGRFRRAAKSNTAYQHDKEYWWSPNSKYLAFRSRIDYQNQYSYNIAHLYSIENNQLTQTVPDNHQAGLMAWAHDSRKLAIAVRSCRPYEQCNNGFDIFATDSNLTERSISITQDFEPAIASLSSIDEAICDLQWSPSMNKLLFKANCGLSLYYYKEFNLVELSTGALQRLTNHTPVATENGNEYNYNIRQTATWVDDNTILVSYNSSRFTLFQENSQVRRGAIERYQLSQGTISILEEGVFVQQWAKRPSADVYATSRLTINPNNADALPAPTLLVSPTANGLSTNQSLPAGCNFEWDPTGTYLAYTPLDGADCSRVSAAVRHVIYNTQTGQSVTVEGVGTPLGWVAVQ